MDKEKPLDIVDLLLDYRKRRFWGKITIRMQDGKVIVVDKLETVKADFWKER